MESVHDVVSLGEIAAFQEKDQAAVAYHRASAQRLPFSVGALVAAESVLNQAFPNQSAVIWY